MKSMIVPTSIASRMFLQYYLHLLILPTGWKHCGKYNRDLPFAFCMVIAAALHWNIAYALRSIWVERNLPDHYRCNAYQMSHSSPLHPAHFNYSLSGLRFIIYTVRSQLCTVFVHCSITVRCPLRYRLLLCCVRAVFLHWMYLWTSDVLLLPLPLSILLPSFFSSSFFLKF